ncbi:MAG: hypothetical protein PHU85_05465 [Phycisphaerae bacterium]|nr:hypothetical protein [Phycisphaerae bacterium]
MNKRKRVVARKRSPRIPKPHDYVNWHLPKAAKANGHGDCRLCGGRCCTYLVVQIDRPRTKLDLDEIRWWLAHHNVQVFIDNDDGTWNAQFHTPCRHLTPRGRCRTYATRFNVCREHASENCEMSAAQMAERCFASVEDFDRYLATRKA